MKEESVSDKRKRLKRDLTCTRCGKQQEMYCQITYSQGDRVCLECKKESRQADRDAYDRWATSRH